MSTEVITLVTPSIVDPALESAFAAVFTAYHDGVYRLLYRITGTREEAEDLAQETFLRLHRAPQLWREGPSGETGHNVRAWLYRVAANLAFNALRGQARRARRQDSAAPEPASIDEQAADPAEAAERAEARATVRAVLAALPERQARLLLLRHAGLSYRELADLIGVAPGSVGALLARAEAAFEKAYLLREGPEGGR